MSATYEYTCEPDGGGTRLTILHRMSGEFPDDFPAAFDDGWMHGLQELKKLVESRG